MAIQNLTFHLVQNLTFKTPIVGPEPNFTARVWINNMCILRALNIEFYAYMVFVLTCMKMVKKQKSVCVYICFSWNVSLFLHIYIYVLWCYGLVQVWPLQGSSSGPSLFLYKSPKGFQPFFLKKKVAHKNFRLHYLVQVCVFLNAPNLDQILTPTWTR